jgi:SAM-dependent methyltransferase
MDRTAQPNFLGVALDTRTISQARLNIDTKERSNLFPWNGQFSPQLVDVLLETYAKPEDFVLDPFLGSGTVLCEAGRRGFRAFGSEVNPAALKMAATYALINVAEAKRRRILEAAGDIIDDLTADASPLFALLRTSSTGPIHEELAQRAAAAPDPLVRRLLEALVVLLNVGNRDIDDGTVASLWGKLRERVLSLPCSDAPIEFANCDARSLPLQGECVDLVVTSPPYINVFNYHQQYRKSVESLGWNLLEVAKSEIGSNRKHRGNRFLTVIQYCLDMLAVFGELRRVCKAGARIIIVVGRESNVRKTVFFNGEIVAGVAVRCAGFRFCARQERVFLNRFGEMIVEDILHFAPVPLNGHAPEPPTLLAREILAAAAKRAPDESQDDLKRALAVVDHVAPSPLYRAEAAQGARPRKRVV